MIVILLIGKVGNSHTTVHCTVLKLATGSSLWFGFSQLIILYNAVRQQQATSVLAYLHAYAFKTTKIAVKNISNDYPS